LQKFHKREGHCVVPRGLEDNGLDIGSWVTAQRSKKDSLTSNQLKRLNALGFSWDPRAEQWEEGFATLQKFQKREGHCVVPRGKNNDGMNLGSWVIKQRSKKDSLTPNQLKRLNSIGFSWNPFAEQWEEGFAALQKFHEREGHCHVSQRRVAEGLNLGGWVTAQRSKKDSLTPNQLKRLNFLGFSWDPRAAQWEEGFARLQKFHKREGHCVVPRGKNNDGINLGSWVSKQRFKEDSLTPDQLKRLNTLGFSWDPFAEQWEEGFVVLKKFHEREGHCRVTQKHQEGRFKLGIWIGTQRAKKDRLSRKKIKRLNALGFVWKP